jgi:hypothetical protein
VGEYRRRSGDLLDGLAAAGLRQEPEAGEDFIEVLEPNKLSIAEDVCGDVPHGSPVIEGEQYRTP